MSVVYDQRLSLGDTLQTQWRILMALMLRDVRTRFFGTALGFLVAILWPLANIFILVAINAVAHRAAPYGSSGILWVASGLVPYTAFNYMSRFTMLGIVMNAPMLGLPVVKVMDLMVARSLVEILNAGCVTILSLLILAALGVSFMPADVVQAFCAMAACMFLGLGFGMINGVIAGVFPFWTTGYALFGIIMWIASGVMFVPDTFPETVRYWLSWNPSLQGVEWMRSAYYAGYGEGVLDKSYMLFCATVAMFLGLVLERVVRRRIRE